MSNKPSGLSNIDTNHLDPSTAPRERIGSTEEVDDGEHDILNGINGSSADLEHDMKTLHEKIIYDSKRELFMSYLTIAIEGDLAGFQIAWLCMSLGFLILKIFSITDVIDSIAWWSIFVIPILNALLTAWFDYIIRKFRSTRTVESLRKSRFVVLWAIKIIFAIYVTTYWIWGRGSFMARYKNTDDYQISENACTGQIICIYISILGAVCMSEVMITTVLINSEQNLSVTRTPMGYRAILLVIRPFVWVYNRTMVMFLCFYAIYGLMYSCFVIGIVCDYLCKSSRCAETQKVGLQMLLVPFTVPDYLINIDQIFNSWDSISDDKYLETFVIVFLCQSFYVDCLNSLWQFSRRYLKPKRTLESSKSIHGGAASPVEKKFMDDLAKELPPSIDMGNSRNSNNSNNSNNDKNETIALKF